MEDAMGDMDQKKETSLRVAVAVHHVVSNLLRGADGTRTQDFDVSSMLPDQKMKNEDSKMSMIMRCKALEVDVQQWKTRCWEEGSRSQSLEEKLRQKEEMLRNAEIDSNESHIALERREMEIRRLTAELEITKRNHAKENEEKQLLKHQCTGLKELNLRINKSAMNAATMLGNICGALNKLLNALTFRAHQGCDIPSMEGESGHGAAERTSTSLLDLLDTFEGKVKIFTNVYDILEGKALSQSKDLCASRALNAKLKDHVHRLEERHQVLNTEAEANAQRIEQMGMELELATQERESVTAESKFLKVRVRELENKHQDCARQHAHLLRERQAMKKGLDKRDMEMDQLRKSNDGLAKRCEENDRTISAGATILEQSQAQIHAYKSQCEQLSEKVEQLLEKLAGSKSNVHQLQAKQEEMQVALKCQENAVQAMHEQVRLLETQLQEENVRSMELHNECKRAQEAAAQVQEVSRAEINRLEEVVEQRNAQCEELQGRLAQCTECVVELGALKGRHRQLTEEFAALRSQLEASHAVLQRLADFAREIRVTLATTSNVLSSPLVPEDVDGEDVEKLMQAAVQAAHHCSEAAAASRDGLAKAHSQLEVATRENAKLSSSVARLRSAVQSEVRARKFRERFASRLHMDLQEAQLALSNMRMGYGAHARHAQQQTRVV
uniref:Uncharacterized protein n=1 Tax=Picocystis salinarum TaxID=88271 RepID=A0A7S3UEM6_9CHLO